jgi:cbb3-type cytochrome oxidase maturation protein
MSIIYLLIPIAILFTAIGIYFFFWAVKSDQFSDLEKQGMSILFDEDPTKTSVDKIKIDVELKNSVKIPTSKSKPNEY